MKLTTLHILGLVPCFIFQVWWASSYVKQEQWRICGSNLELITIQLFTFKQLRTRRKGKQPISSPEEVETDDSGA
jgi:hypothetical protein